ncbi:MAG: M55 family metallopeptidase [Gemmatimonadetes bacterium]|nr:M55 family metallopeptidase [Gemmatimonadota bacterium]MCH7715215.1 M55 family metallopeptidase [Gemmatimonadota bacterium]
MLSLRSLALVLVPAAPLTTQQSISVYISADMEGVAAISATDDPLGRRLMTAEVNAAIAGAFDAGATRVVVNDAHGGHNNLIQTDLDPRVTFLRGDLKPYGMMQGLDSTFTAVLFVGYHGKARSRGGFLAHTGSGRTADLRVNGTSIGEGGMNALYAAWYGVPVVFISGDSLAVSQLEALVPDVGSAVVKTGIWNRAVRSLTPDSARAAIRRGVTAALGRAPSVQPVAAPPFRVELSYTDALYADIAEGIPSVDRVDATTVGFTVDEYPAAYRMIRVLYKHLTQ